MRVVIAAGGTGGHFYPGLAVARELLAAGHEVHFLIKKGDFVRPLLERESIPYVAISAGGFRRTLDPRHVFTVIKLIQGFFETLRYLSSNRPGALLVMGGYLSVPPAVAARVLRIPVLLHEQNVIPGLANRLLNVLASRVAISFPSSRISLGKKAVLTGNPVRAEFNRMPGPDEARKKWGLDPGKLTILVFGGSLGAHRLNELILDAAGSLSLHAARFQFLHITGPADVTRVRERYAKTLFTHYVDSYCHDMPSAYAAGDLVIARSGASTISELLVVKKPAVLIPYPHSTGDHQTANARVLADAGAAVIHQQKDLEQGRAAVVLEALMKNPAAWQAWAENYRKVEIDPLGAAKLIAGLITSVIPACLKPGSLG